MVIYFFFPKKLVFLANLKSNDDIQALVLVSIRGFESYSTKLEQEINNL